MNRRIPTVLFLVFAASLWVATTHGQDETITNAEQLAAVIDQSGLWYPLVSPMEQSLSSQALGIFWADFSQLTNAIGDVRNFEAETQYGISVWRLRLTRTADGITFSYASANTNLLELAATEDGPPNARPHTSHSTQSAVSWKTSCGYGENWLPALDGLRTLRFEISRPATVTKACFT